MNLANACFYAANHTMFTMEMRPDGINGINRLWVAEIEGQKLDFCRYLAPISPLYHGSTQLIEGILFGRLQDDYSAAVKDGSLPNILTIADKSKTIEESKRIQALRWYDEYKTWLQTEVDFSQAKAAQLAYLGFAPQAYWAGQNKLLSREELAQVNFITQTSLNLQVLNQMRDPQTGKLGVLYQEMPY